MDTHLDIGVLVFSVAYRRVPRPPRLPSHPFTSHNSSHPTHLTTFITDKLISHTTRLTLTHTPTTHVTHLKPPISHISSHTQLISNHSSHTSHLTHTQTELISHLSSHVTHLTPLITHLSSHTTKLTPAHTTHTTPRIPHHSSHTTHLSHYSSLTSHLSPVISYHSSHTGTIHLTALKHTLRILHHSSHTKRILYSGERHKTSHVGLSGPCINLKSFALCSGGALIQVASYSTDMQSSYTDDSHTTSCRGTVADLRSSRGTGGQSGSVLELCEGSRESALKYVYVNV